MHPGSCCILLVVLFFSKAVAGSAAGGLNLTLPHQHPNPDEVVQELHRRVNHSVSRRQMLATSTTADSTSASSSPGCMTGNPIDDCWRCDPQWNTPAGRQRLADCGIGFGSNALGGKGGPTYIVTDSSDSDAVNPKPGTLRYGVLQEEPLWIIFASDMTIKLQYELIVMSYKTIDGRGHNVHVTGGGCITIQYVSNVIIHNIHVHDCYPSGNAEIRASPTHVGFRRKSDGDGISVSGSSKIWIDHCSLSNCKDGLIDVVFGSTAITISNNYFSHHNEVMLLGNDDGDTLDIGMQVTIAFNHFGQGLVQRMPRCRRGYIHVVNNDITYWEIYAIGGSANPTINSQGNRYIAPSNPSAKEVTKRVDTDEHQWTDWNWRTEGDIMENGAFFVPSGEGLSMQYARASSLEPRSSGLIDQLTLNAGVFGDPRDGSNVGYKSGGGPGSDSGSGSGGGGGDTDLFGMIFGGGSGGGGGFSAAAQSKRRAAFFTTILASLFTISIIVISWSSSSSSYPRAASSNRLGGCAVLLLSSLLLLSLTMMLLL